MKASVVLLLSTLGMLGLVPQATADTHQLELQLGEVLEVRGFASLPLPQYINRETQESLISEKMLWR